VFVHFLSRTQSIVCPQGKLSKKAPFSQYEQLGAQVVWGSPTDPASIPAGAFDVVYDNNGKDLEACKPLIDHFKVWCWHFGLLGCVPACLVCVCPPVCKVQG
jgi:hypothetical protein